MRRMTDLTSERFSVDHKFDSFANCKCKLDTCTVELSESEHRSGWKPLASVLWFPRTLSVRLVDRLSMPCRVSGLPALAALSGRCAAL